MKKLAVPVVMYHSIGVVNKKWKWNYLTCPYELFEDQLKWLKKREFHTITLLQLHEYMRSGYKLPKNPIVLTFDDGYLDNWIYAYPLLKKYGFKGTIFVSPEFVDLIKECRPNLEDVWTGKKKISQLKNTGFLSWKEMERMENEKVIDIQSHALTHSWYFKSNKIVDFRYPGDEYIWMTWNNNLNRKPHLQLDDERLIQFGAPVYEYGKSLEIKKYFPDSTLAKTCVEYVNENGGKSFFKKGWRKELFEIVANYKKHNEINDRYETNKEYEDRVRTELKISKEIIEKNLNKEVKFLCWPGGGINRTGLRIASELGYLSSTYASKEIQHKKFRNMPGEDPSRFRRSGPVLYWDGKASYNSKVKYKNGFLLILFLSQFQYKKFIALLGKILLSGISRLYKIKFLFIFIFFMILILVTGSTFSTESSGDGTMELNKLLPQQLLDWSAEGKDTIFTRASIFDYMNGAGEIYLAFDFKRLLVREYKVVSKPPIVAEVYEMSSSQDAFGVFSHDRDGEEMLIGQEALYSLGLLRFWKDMFYVRILAEVETEATKEAVILLGKHIANKIPDMGIKPDLVKCLPLQGLIKNSIRYFHKQVSLNILYYLGEFNLLGLNDDTDVILADYIEDDHKTKLLVCKYENSVDSKMAFQECAKVYFSRKSAIKSNLVIDKLENDRFSCIFLMERFLIMVFEAEHRETCEKFITQVKEKIREVYP